MQDTPATPTPPQEPPKPNAYQTSREQVRKRVRRYKRSLTVAALLGFGVFGVVIAHPNLALFTSSTSSSQSTQNSQNSFFNQQGSSTVDGSTTSTQTQPPLHPLHKEATPVGMTKTTFHAMGTDITVMLPIALAAAEASRVEQLFADWERTLTRFQPESELSQLNQHPGMLTFISPLLCEVLHAALQAAQATNGIYDPTLLRQLRQAGYDRSFEQLPLQQPAAAGNAVAGGVWRDIVVDPVARCVFLPIGAQIDLGGIAKGMAVDAALAQLRADGVAAALVNAGGDLGVIGLPPELDHWPIVSARWHCHSLVPWGAGDIRQNASPLAARHPNAPPSHRSAHWHISAKRSATARR